MSKIKKRDIDGVNRIVNDNKTRMNSVHFLHLEAKNVQKVQWLGFVISRERKCTFSLDLRPFGPFGSRRSKKQSRSTRRGLRVTTYLVEFRQLQEVGIFSYLCYSLAKSHVNG